MRTKGSAAELEARRLWAGRLLLEGNDIPEVAELVEASVSSVKRWMRAVKKGGLVALKAKPHPGRKPRLNDRQKQRLVEILLAGPIRAGYATDLWTCRRVAEVIDKKLGVAYHPDHVWKLLHHLGWTCQKPEHRARERNAEAIEHWRNADWPRIKRGPCVGATL